MIEVVKPPSKTSEAEIHPVQKDLLPSFNWEKIDGPGLLKDEGVEEMEPAGNKAEVVEVNVDETGEDEESMVLFT
jgi:hypothetical protein